MRPYDIATLAYKSRTIMTHLLVWTVWTLAFREHLVYMYCCLEWKLVLTQHTACREHPHCPLREVEKRNLWECHWSIQKNSGTDRKVLLVHFFKSQEDICPLKAFWMWQRVPCREHDWPTFKAQYDTLLLGRNCTLKFNTYNCVWTTNFYPCWLYFKQWWTLLLWSVMPL